METESFAPYDASHVSSSYAHTPEFSGAFLGVLHMYGDHTQKQALYQ